jgi:hypothetical protein
MMFIEVTPESLRENPFPLIGSDRMLITAGTAELSARNLRRAGIDMFPGNDSRCHGSMNPGASAFERLG